MLFGLLIIYQIKHWVCDYPLQGKYMLGKFGEWPKWVLPLLSHSAVHGLATYVIAYCVRPDLALNLALFDFSTHFLVDRIKASPNLGGRYKSLSAAEYMLIAKQQEIFTENTTKEGITDSFRGLYKEALVGLDKQIKGNTFFWWLLGLDQMAHHLTHYAIIYALVK